MGKILKFEQKYSEYEDLGNEIYDEEYFANENDPEYITTMEKIAIYIEEIKENFYNWLDQTFNSLN